MSGTPQYQETMRITSIVNAFNNAVNQAVGQDPAARAKLDAVMTPERIQALQTATVAMIALVQKMMSQGESEALQLEIAVKGLQTVDLAMSYAIEAGLEDKFRACFPLEEQTAENAQILQRLGAPHLARLCA